MSSRQSLSKPHRKTRQVTFSRNELRILLNEYSRRVAAGEWRDYAIDLCRDRAVFSVFRHTAEHPLYSIEKFPGKGGRPERYAVSRGPQRLKQSQNLNDVLGAIERRPRLVAIG
ncbi:MAG: hypothetical protein CL566_06275 [Alphaproteobacteria bacterium]|nr:hypothetical protein [Alphaproteobacteria bacterium]|tara:strand:+ start:970 stop:1311 length:342 start_codon:yes stop_codon:yes gene_type:complete